MIRYRRVLTDKITFKRQIKRYNNQDHLLVPDKNLYPNLLSVRQDIIIICRIQVQVTS